MNVPLDEVIHFDCITTTPSTGAAVDADSTPTFAVYEESTDTDIGIGGNLTKRTSLTGNYRGTFTLSAANGFEVGKWYSIIGSAVVGGVTGKAVLKNFRVVAAEAIAGKPKADVDAWLGTTVATPGTAGAPSVDTVRVGGTVQTAGDLAALISLISIATGAGSLATKTSDSAVLTTGSNTSGSHTDTASDNDVYWITAPVTPAVDGFGLRQQLVFNLPLGRIPVNIIVRGYWNGSGQTADVYALNSRTAAYDKLTNTGTNLASRNTELLYTIPLPRDYSDDSGGSFNIVTLEFRSASTNTGHRLRVDQMLVTHLDEQVATTLVVPQPSDIWSYITRTLTTPGAEPSDAPTVEEIADAVWDEILTGASHNTASSAGKRLRQISAPAVAHSGTAQAGGSTSITLDAGASSVDDFYVPGIVTIEAGTGAVQFRRISAYNGTTKVATVSTAWATNPASDSDFVISAWASVRVSDLEAGPLADINAEVDTALADYDGPTNAEMEARTLVAASYFDPAADTVARVTLVDTTTTNTDMRGTDSAATASALATLNDLSQADVRTAVGLAAANLDSQLDDLPTNAELTTALGTADDAVLAAIAALNNLSSADITAAAPTANQNAAAILDLADAIETGLTVRKALRAIAAKSAGDVAGAGTGTETVAGAGVATNRLTATVDVNGNITWSTNL